MLQFELDHLTPLEDMRRHLFAAADLVPNNVRPQEAAALEEESSRLTRSRKSGGDNAVVPMALDASEKPGALSDHHA